MKAISFFPGVLVVFSCFSTIANSASAEQARPHPIQTAPASRFTSLIQSAVKPTIVYKQLQDWDAYLKMSATTEVDGLNISELMLGYIPNGQIPRIDLANSLTAIKSYPSPMTDLQRRPVDPPIYFPEIRHFSDFYSNFVKSHSSQLRMQTDIAMFEKELQQIQKGYATTLEKSDRQIFRIDFPDNALTQSMYNVETRSLTFTMREPKGVLDQLKNIIGVDTRESEYDHWIWVERHFTNYAACSRPIVFYAELDRVEKWLEDAAQCGVIVSVLYRNGRMFNYSQTPRVVYYQPIEVLGVALVTCQEPREVIHTEVY